MQDETRRWWGLPQARYLFNSPYHCVGPVTQEDIVRRISFHIASCNACCLCGIDDFMERIRNRLHNAKVESNRAQGGEIRVTKVIKRTASLKHQRQFTKPMQCKLSCASSQSTASMSLQPPISGTGPVATVQSESLGRQDSLSLCFPLETSSWQPMDNQCDDTAGKCHPITNPNSFCSSLSTEVIQDLRAHCLTGDVIYAYLSTLCTQITTIRCAVLDPIENSTSPILPRFS